MVETWTAGVGNRTSGQRIQNIPGECQVVKDPKMANSGHGVRGSLDEIPTQPTGIYGGQDSVEEATYLEHPYWSLYGHISSLCFWDEGKNLPAVTSPNRKSSCLHLQVQLAIVLLELLFPLY